MSASGQSKRVVLLFASPSNSRGDGASALDAESSMVTALLGESGSDVAVDVVSIGLEREVHGAHTHVRMTAPYGSLTDRLLRMVGANKLHRWLSRYPVGRLLNSLGPMDAGRVFSRAVRSSADASKVVRNADTIIATDIASVKLAYREVRRGRVGAAHYDTRSASFGVAVPDLDTHPH